MSLFTISLIIGFSAVILLNMIFSFAFSTALYLFLCFVIVMLPAAGFLFIGRPIFKKYYKEDWKAFRENKFTSFIAKVTRVKTWKDKIPVGGRVAGFRMNKLENPKSVEYLERYMFESCFAEYLHFSIFAWCFVAMVILLVCIPKYLFFRMVFPIAILFAYQNITSVIIQWYMRPRIVKYRDSLKLRQQYQIKNKIEEVKA